MVDMDMSHMMSMDKLPQEITLDILSRLPAEYVLNCKQVCKTWLTIIDHHPCFAQIHLNRRLLMQLHQQHLHDSPMINGFEMGFIFINDGELWYKKYEENNDDEHDEKSYRILITRIFRPPMTKDPVIIIGSCNGLICLSYGVRDPVCICNPVTREYAHIPKFMGNELEYKGYESEVMGFGYHPRTNEYKVVRIYYRSVEAWRGQVQVYTLGSGNGWREVGEIRYLLTSNGVLAYGEIHWEVVESKIMAFDLANEEFHYLASPPFGDDTDNWLIDDHNLWALGGSLSIFHRVPTMASGGGLFSLSHVDVWLGTKKTEKSTTTSYDIIEQEFQTWSWRKEFTLPPINYKIVPLGLTKKGEIFCWQTKGGFLSRYDGKTATIEKLVDDDYEMGHIEVVPHVNSFVSLRALGENGTSR